MTEQPHVDISLTEDVDPARARRLAGLLFNRPQPPRITPPFNWRHDLESSFAEQRAGCTCDGDRCTWEPGGTGYETHISPPITESNQRQHADNEGRRIG